MSSCKKCHQKIEPRPGDVWRDDDGSTIIFMEDGSPSTVNPWGSMWGISPKYTNPTKLLYRPSREGLEGPNDA
jgi:hypothetical protein